MVLVVLFSELLFPAPVLELGVVLPVLPEVAPRILCCCPPACWLPSALVSHRLLLGNSSSIWGSLDPVCGCFPAPCAALSPQAELDILCSSALLLLRSSSSSRGI